MSGPRRVIVQGGAGFLGRWLCAAWLAHDPEVLVTAVDGRPWSTDQLPHMVCRGPDRMPAPSPADIAALLGEPRFRAVQVSPDDQPGLTALFAEVQPHVVSFANSVRDVPPERLFENASRVTCFLEALAGSGARPDRVVVASSSAVYGRATSYPTPECSELAPVDLHGVSRAAAEQAAGVLGARHGLRICVARLYNPIGPGQDEDHLASHVAAQAVAATAGLGPPVIRLRDMHATRDFIDVRDAARGLVFIGERGVPGTAYNLGTGVETSVRDLVDAIRKAAGAERAVVQVTRGGEALLPRSVAHMARMAEIGFKTDYIVDDAVASTVAYYRTQVVASSGSTGGDTGVSVQTVRVAPVAHAYPVHIGPGALERVAPTLQAMAPHAKIFLLTDDTVLPLVAEPLAARLRAAGRTVVLHSLPAGETVKTYEAFTGTIAAMYAAGFHRRDLLLAVGGGTILDAGGFVAASYLRGVAYAAVPTTLLAQHDAAVGGKVAVNTDWAKNFVGAFHHPRAVFADSEVLSTLEDRDIAAGVAEAIKVAICGAPDLFRLLESGVQELREQRDPAWLAAVVRQAVARKRELLNPDPYEVDLRRVLNLGHTYAHPLETELGYEGLRHGEAVGFGLAVATCLAHLRGMLAASDRDRVLALLVAYGLPPRVPRDRVWAALDRLGAVRLVRAGALNFVLPVRTDRVEIVADVGLDELRGALLAVAVHPLTRHAVC